jgi:hypothetical protein
MTRCEKFVLASLVDQADAKVAVEVGTFKGGSLQVVSARSEKVYSLDINKENQEALKPQFPDVEFLAGDSRILLPKLIDKLQFESAPLGFVLIDGDHSTEAVRSDINSLLRFVPNRPVYIVLHDSFNPECRTGMLTADWKKCPYVHFVEIDFVTGMFFREGLDIVQPRSMWGGMAVAIMLPQKREIELEILESQRDLFEAVLPHSSHFKYPKKSLLQRIADKFMSRQRGLGNLDGCRRLP